MIDKTKLVDDVFPGNWKENAKYIWMDHFGEIPTNDDRSDGWKHIEARNSQKRRFLEEEKFDDSNEPSTKKIQDEQTLRNPAWPWMGRSVPLEPQTTRPF